MPHRLASPLNANVPVRQYAMPPAVDARLQPPQHTHPVATAPCCRHVFQGVHMLMQFGSSAEGMGRPWVRTEGAGAAARTCPPARCVKVFLAVLFVVHYYQPGLMLSHSPEPRSPASRAMASAA